MKFAALFATSGLALAWLAWWAGGPAWVLTWPAANLFVLAVAYGKRWPWLLGKRADGRLRPEVVLPLLPYYGITFISWHLWRRLTPESPGDEVAPGIWVGRRPVPSELPPGCAAVVDLTAELAPDPTIRTGAGYLCRPTLDARAPDDASLREAVEHILAAQGPVWVHCAVGHGRSATVAAAALIARGDVGDVDAAQSFMRAARPAIKLHGDQRRAVARFAAAWITSGRTAS